jgi:multisubunit Na+/H+ antiporter MnhB subunit
MVILLCSIFSYNPYSPDLAFQACIIWRVVVLIFLIT